MTSSLALPARKPARSNWAFVPVALLLSSALGVGSMALVAARDPHFATESDYYQKAIRWDQVQAQAAENQRLGYAIALPSRVRLNEQSQAELELSLTDGSSRPVSGARVTAEAFANAYSGVSQRLAFHEAAAGTYTAGLSAVHPGLWVVRVRAEVGRDIVTADLRADLTRAGAP